MLQASLWFIGGILFSILLLLFDWLYGDRWIGRIFWWRNTRIRVVRVDREGEHPQVRAKVIVSGQGRRFTNAKGEAVFYVPREDIYGLVVETADGKFQGGTMNQQLVPGEEYLYSLNDAQARRFEKDRPYKRSGLGTE